MTPQALRAFCATPFGTNHCTRAPEERTKNTTRQLFMGTVETHGRLKASNGEGTNARWRSYLSFTLAFSGGCLFGWRHRPIAVALHAPDFLLSME